MRTEVKTPVTVLCGFLGSGKTTLMRRWREAPELRNAAFIVHDFSEFGVDADLIAEEGSRPKPGELVDRVAALHGTFAREDLHESTGRALREIACLEPKTSHVLCESTGAARPWPLIQAVTQNDRFYLRHFIVTVDALNLHRDFGDGRVFVGEAGLSADPALQHAAALLAEQILFASAIIVTKVDSVPKAVVETQIRILKTLQPHATIGLSTLSGIQLGQFDVSPAPQLHEMHARAAQFGLSNNTPTASAVESVIIRDERPFHPQRLYDVCQQQLGTGVYRTKGFLWLASRASDVLLWQQSGSQISLELTSVWAAEAVKNRYGKLHPEEVAILQKQVDAAHPVFGDRRTELTVIGLPDDCHTFAQGLKNALCTKKEIKRWQQGKPFADPWPQRLRKIT